MSTTRHRPQEVAPRRQYQAAIVVPVVVFAFLAGAAAGYSLGRMGRDDGTGALPVGSDSSACSAAAPTASQAVGITAMTRSAHVSVSASPRTRIGTPASRCSTSGASTERLAYPNIAR